VLCGCAPVLGLNCADRRAVVGVVMADCSWGSFAAAVVSFDDHGQLDLEIVTADAVNVADSEAADATVVDLSAAEVLPDILFESAAFVRAADSLCGLPVMSSEAVVVAADLSVGSYEILSADAEPGCNSNVVAEPFHHCVPALRAILAAAAVLHLYAFATHSVVVGHSEIREAPDVALHRTCLVD